jgi:hypothetical protein
MNSLVNLIAPDLVQLVNVTRLQHLVDLASDPSADPLQSPRILARLDPDKDRQIRTCRLPYWRIAIP